MKRIVLFVFLVIITMGTSMVTASTKVILPPKISTENKMSQVEIKQLENRVYEIRNMNKSTLSIKERGALRNELRTIKHKLSIDGGGGIYLSGAAIIIIILLLILLL